MCLIDKHFPLRWLPPHGPGACFSMNHIPFWRWYTWFITCCEVQLHNAYQWGKWLVHSYVSHLRWSNQLVLGVGFIQWPMAKYSQFGGKGESTSLINELFPLVCLPLHGPGGYLPINHISHGRHIIDLLPFTRWGPTMLIIHSKRWAFSHVSHLRPQSAT